jgi:hypothetical protein
MKILTEYGKSKPILNPKQSIFKISQLFWTSDSRWDHVALQRKEIFQTLYSQEQTFWHRTIQTMWLNWIPLWQKSVPGEVLTACGTTLDSITCHSGGTKKVEECGHKLYTDYMDNFFSYPDLLIYLTKKNKLLLHCQTKYEEHATWP